ncbi:type II secretion system protein [Cyanobium gracile]|uniref:Type II secretion system protein n=1 Tax=Cyanobium gracile UHCC 0281 TaxID=3110309 RepID=A0ABU5SST4_9CYAN|nr:type II secretion system protein [Cyanobium gracile]MEA5441578.1 type II secretion system protein [Cyanobium gracile UHCC 0281]
MGSPSSVPAGFTLIELMIVMSLVGILSVVLLPQYFRTKIQAEAAISIAETLSFAEQCAVANKSGIAVTVQQPFNGAARICNGQAVRQINSRTWSGDAAGIQCLGVTANGSQRRARIRVATDGSLTCRFI